MTRVRWTVPALRVLEELQDRIAQENPAAAARLATRITAAIDGLAAFPLKGHPGRVSSTYELTIPRTPYTAAYRVRGEVVEVVALVHQARRWPESFA